MATDSSYHVSGRDYPYDNSHVGYTHDPEMDSGRMDRTQYQAQFQFRTNEDFNVDVGGTGYRYGTGSNSHLNAGGLPDDPQNSQFDPYVNLPPARHSNDYHNAWDREGNAGEEDDFGQSYQGPTGGTLSRADKFGTIELYQEDRPNSALGSERPSYRGGVGSTLNPQRPPSLMGQSYSDDRPDGLEPMTVPSWQNSSFAAPLETGSNEPRSQMGEAWRNPELPEVIEFLSSPDDRVKAHAAAYLQHLSYGNDPVKSETRTLNGIQPLVELLYSNIDEVNYNAVGALRNLSYGRNNDENKREIRKHGGIQGLVHLLKNSPRSEVRELVTAVLWNLSSFPELKSIIIDQVVPSLIDVVILPHAGLEKRPPDGYISLQREIYWSTLFRNASGVVRNVSSDSDLARKKLREADGLVDSLVHIVRSAIANNDIDNKSVENCVCTLRNLCYACQEVVDASYLRKRHMRKQQQQKQNNSDVGCLGKKSKTTANARTANGAAGGVNAQPVIQKPLRGPAMGQDLLWQPHIVELYLPILSDCSNPETLEAAAGAIQNLAACEWQPSIDIRTQVRKEKGLPIMVELLNIGSDRVVCSAATALRNLAIDQRNKELIGKYAMEHLVRRLPSETEEVETSNETIAALLATIYTVIKGNQDFAVQVLDRGGVHRCMFITTSQRFGPKVTQFATAVLQIMWHFKELQPRYRELGWRDTQFGIKAGIGGSKSSSNAAHSSMTRPAMTQSGPSARMNTLPRDKMVQRHPIGSGGTAGSAGVGGGLDVRSGGVDPNYTNVHVGQPIAGAGSGSYAIEVGGGVDGSGTLGSQQHLIAQRDMDTIHNSNQAHLNTTGGGQFDYNLDVDGRGRYGDGGVRGYENAALDTGYSTEAPNTLSRHSQGEANLNVNMGSAGGYDNSAFLNGGPVRPDDIPMQNLTLNDYNPYSAHADRHSVHSGGALSFNRSNPNIHHAAVADEQVNAGIEPLYARVDRDKKRRFQGSQGSGLNVSGGGGYDGSADFGGGLGGGVGGSVTVDVGVKIGGGAGASAGGGAGADSWV